MKKYYIYKKEEFDKNNINILVSEGECDEIYTRSMMRYGGKFYCNEDEFYSPHSPQELLEKKEKESVNDGVNDGLIEGVNNIEEVK